MTTKRPAMLAIWLLCCLGACIALLRMFGLIVIGSDRAWRIAVALDRVDNAASGGTDTETISSRAYRAQQEGKPWGCVLCKILDNIQKDHCKNSAGI